MRGADRKHELGREAALTEAQAAERWCPFARVATGSGSAPAVNRWGAAADARCIGNRCMAWRWTDPGFEAGYCGLAGIPVIEP